MNYHGGCHCGRIAFDVEGEIEQVMQPVAEALNNDEMIELGKKVDVDGEDAAIVARDWMIEKGFIGRDTA